MNRRRLHHYIKNIIRVKPRYLLAATVICGAISLVALRSNYEHMKQLRQAVYTADKNNGDVQGALQNLQAYVTSHMNTELSSGNTTVYPPIQLKYTYDRLAEQRSQAAVKANQTVYSDAQAYCEAQNPNDFSGRNRVPCIEQYVSSRGGKLPAPVPADLYKFDFVTPAWSPDLAGWSLVATIVLGVLTLTSFALRRLKLLK